MYECLSCEVGKGHRCSADVSQHVDLSAHEVMCAARRWLANVARAGEQRCGHSAVRPDLSQVCNGPPVSIWRGAYCQQIFHSWSLRSSFG